jgi:glycosyltransferase involved in cell wall biosynthesis
MKIAFIGQKGIPFKWGGVENHVEELATRLVKRNHEVTVFVRDWYTPKNITSYEGVKIRHAPSINTMSLDCITHSLNCSIVSLFHNFDIIHYHAIGSCLACWIPKIFFKKIVATIHRYDYESGKWNNFSKKVLKISEKCALKIPNKTIVVAKYLKVFYRSLGYNTIYIPNGVDIPNYAKPDIIKKEYNLNGRDYILFLGRLVPEKRCDWIIKAYNNLVSKNLNRDLKLVIAGESSSTDSYVEYLKKIGDSEKIIFTGNVTGLKKQELFSNALLFILPSSIEGLPITILEASSYKIPVLASDIPAHKEVIIPDFNGFLFDNKDFDDFENKLLKVLDYPENKMKEIGTNALNNVKKNYNWDKIVDQTENIYLEVLVKQIIK